VVQDDLHGRTRLPDRLPEVALDDVAEVVRELDGDGSVEAEPCSNTARCSSVASRGRRTSTGLLTSRVTTNTNTVTKKITIRPWAILRPRTDPSRLRIYRVSLASANR
jgi:hypothetical protein